MINLGTTDRRLLDALKQDSRATVTTLASKLGVSRATIQSHLNRLVETGVIQRFTIEIDSSVSAESVRAVMMIELEGMISRTIVGHLRRIPEIVSLHSTNGNWDLVAQIESATLPEFDKVLRQVREIRGVLNSETNILLNRAFA